MRTRVSGLIAVFCVVLAVAGPALAGTTSWSGRLDNADPKWNRVGNGCGVTAVPLIEWHDAQPFSVDVTGSYTIAMTALTGGSADAFYALYDLRFDAANPTANCLATNDDGGPGLAPELIVNLVAGRTYVLVTSPCCSGTAPGSELDYTNAITGPGFASLFSSLAMDIDGDGRVDALTDGLLLIRWQFGLTGPSLIANAVNAGATRTTAPAIEAYLKQLGVHSGPNLLTLTALVGGTGGASYTSSCDPGSVAVGLIVAQGLIEPPDLGSITIRCAPLTFGALGAAGIGAPTTNLAPIGTGAGAAVQLNCASGSVITGIEGSTKLVFSGSQTVVENLSLQCSPLAPGAMAIVGPAGAGNTTPFVLPCPAGSAMRGLQGRADQLVDALQIRCQ